MTTQTSKQDQINQLYFNLLYKQLANNTSDSSTIVLSMGERDASKETKNIAMPIPLLTSEQRKALPIVSYRNLKQNYDKCSTRNSHNDIVLWQKKMNGGIGSSIERTSYLKDIIGINRNLEAKGLDLFFNVDGKYLSIVEIQILKSLIEVESGKYKKLLIDDLVSSETIDGMNNLRKVFFSRHSEFSHLESNLVVFRNVIEQKFNPTIDENNKLSYRRVSPSGHGFFAFEFLLEIFKCESLNDIEGLEFLKDSDNLICTIGNGEDLGSSPDRCMIDWVVESNIPIAMILTDKTSIDLKGGQLSLVVSNSTSVQRQNYLTIFERAQTQNSEETKKFENIGLNDKVKSLFNTNTVIFNCRVLKQIFNGPISSKSLDEFIKMISPDLIKNFKKQVDVDGVERAYMQLEGAMGSLVLNLDRSFREMFGKNIVHFINVEEEYRTNFFAPIKTAFDFWMLAHSDLFCLNKRSFQLVKTNINPLPHVHLNGELFANVKNTLRIFKNLSLVGANSIVVDAKELSCLPASYELHEDEVENLSTKIIKRSDADK